MKADRLTARQRVLLKKIQMEFPEGWFLPEFAGTIDDLDALRNAGYLKRRMTVSPPTVRAYRLNPECRP